MKCAARQSLFQIFGEEPYCEQCGKERFLDCECRDNEQAALMADYYGISMNEATEVVAKERKLRLEIDNEK